MSDGWVMWVNDGQERQIVPVNDEIGHTYTADCPCGPTLAPLPEGTWLHHALDGRR